MATATITLLIIMVANFSRILCDLQRKRQSYPNDRHFNKVSCLNSTTLAVKEAGRKTAISQIRKGSRLQTAIQLEDQVLLSLREGNAEQSRALSTLKAFQSRRQTKRICSLLYIAFVYDESGLSERKVLVALPP